MNVIIKQEKRPPLADTMIDSHEGDEWTDEPLADAVERAVRRSAERGCRQQVRMNRRVYSREFRPGIWIIQDVR